MCKLLIILLDGAFQEYQSRKDVPGMLILFIGNRKLASNNMHIMKNALVLLWD